MSGRLDPHATIERLRAGMQMSVYRLEKASGISKCAIRNWARFGAMPRLDTLDKLASGIGMSLGELIAEFERDRT